MRISKRARPPARRSSFPDWSPRAGAMPARACPGGAPAPPVPPPASRHPPPEFHVYAFFIRAPIPLTRPLRAFP
ncbi:hypothetical protein C6P88_21265 [Burkholderia contaminans]|nr:hypothetical protein C6P88_21265 [Burkholderia contaminans]